MPHMETMCLHCDVFPSSAQLLHREPHVPGTGSDLPVTTLSVWKPSQTLQLA